MGILRGKTTSFERNGWRHKIANLNEHIETIFETIGLDEIFNIYNSVEEAISKFPKIIN